MGYHKGKSQISAYIDADVKRGLRVRAAMEGRRINEVLERALKSHLATKHEPKDP